MKKLLLFLVLLSTCMVQAQRKPKIKGNRSVVEVHKELPPFNAIELVDNLEIFLQKSSNEGYSINADDNLVDVLKFKVKDSTLIITAFYKITSKKKLDITINYTELRGITLHDGKINMKDVISSDELYVNTFGASRLELNATAAFININMEDMSSGDFNLASDSLNITLKDRIDVRIYSVGDSNAINMYKNTTARMEGTTDSFYVNLFGSANLKAEKLEATTVHAVLEESPTARLYALKSLELSSKGSSKTYFYGDGKVVMLDFLDTSQLHKEK